MAGEEEMHGAREVEAGFGKVARFIHLFDNELFFQTTKLHIDFLARFLTPSGWDNASRTN